jgi:hypothetical protein
MLDTTIRRSADIFGIVDSRLVVPVPYIVTKSEQLQNKRRMRILIAAASLLLTSLLVVLYFMMPALDLIIAKARVGLFH